jgi:uncharacterized membrane protein
MTLPSLKSLKKYSELDIAIVISIIMGIVIASGIVFFEIRNERFSAVYINPDSYTNYPETGTISFVYGISSHEKVRASYTITIREGENLVDTKQIELNPGDVYEEKKVIQLPDDAVYPVKISVQYKSPFEINEVFFRVRNESMMY